MEEVSRFDLTDKINKVHIRITVSKKGWNRYVSQDKKKWIKTHSDLSLTEALTIREEVINNNFKNLFKIITSEQKRIKKLDRK